MPESPCVFLLHRLGNTHSLFIGATTPTGLADLPDPLGDSHTDAPVQRAIVQVRRLAQAGDEAIAMGIMRLVRTWPCGTLAQAEQLRRRLMKQTRRLGPSTGDGRDDRAGAKLHCPICTPDHEGERLATWTGRPMAESDPPRNVKNTPRRGVKQL